MIADVFHKRRIWRWKYPWWSKPFDFELDEHRFDAVAIDDRVKLAREYPPDYRWIKATTWEELLRVVRIEYPGMWRFANIPVHKWMVLRDGDKKTWVETGEVVKRLRLGDVTLDAEQCVGAAETRARGFRVVESFATFEDYAAFARKHSAAQDVALASDVDPGSRSAEIMREPAYKRLPSPNRLRIEVYTAISAHTRVEGMTVARIRGASPGLERVVAAFEPFEPRDDLQATESGLYRRTVTPRDKPVGILCPNGAELRVGPRGSHVVWTPPGEPWAAAGAENAYRYASEGRFGFEFEFQDGPVVAPEVVGVTGEPRQLTLF